MKPEDLWVVFNSLSATILFVYPEEFMAERKKKRLWETIITGSTPNNKKIVHITMSKALSEINAFHLGAASCCE
jgi:hypothetical protein